MSGQPPAKKWRYDRAGSSYIARSNLSALDDDDDLCITEQDISRIDEQVEAKLLEGKSDDDKRSPITKSIIKHCDTLVPGAKFDLTVPKDTPLPPEPEIPPMLRPHHWTDDRGRAHIEEMKRQVELSKKAVRDKEGELNIVRYQINDKERKQKILESQLHKSETERRELLSEKEKQIQQLMEKHSDEMKFMKQDFETQIAQSEQTPTRNGAGSESTEMPPPSSQPVGRHSTPTRGRRRTDHFGPSRQTFYDNTPSRQILNKSQSTHVLNGSISIKPEPMSQPFIKQEVCSQPVEQPKPETTDSEMQTSLPKSGDHSDRLELHCSDDLKFVTEAMERFELEQVEQQLKELHGNKRTLKDVLHAKWRKKRQL